MNANFLQQSLIAVLLISLSAVAGPSRSAEYINIKPLLVAAIDAADGKANGTIVGPIADKFRTTTGSLAPVLVRVSTIKSFKQEGCRRLNVRMSQANVMTRDGKATDFGIDYGFNVCRNGSPPTEGMNLEQAGKILGNRGPD